ncbi:hypothetical protein PR048_020713 [Dryococelus australis]|uniref:Uncharacterized protein n=1 Tax=Dryococelus australis TaxID=614101 RepID=A0ABQ9H787_9NEOP|nr:hypothetical protein PR048_020713 [Dryococelus australis]
MNKTSTKLYDIATIQKDPGDMQNAVLFAHVVIGGDKTSAIYGKGKIKAYRLLQKNVSLRSEVVNIFNSPASHPEEVAKTGERFFRALYPGGKKSDSIDDLRLHLYNRTDARLALTASFELAVLPPTNAGSSLPTLTLFKFYIEVSKHFLCFQIQEWRRNELLPTDWGWHFSNSQDTLMPVLTTLPPALRFFMRVITCTCKRDCNARRSCRKAGERSSDMCGHCRGTNCLNAVSYEIDTDEL